MRHLLWLIICFLSPALLRAQTSIDLREELSGELAQHFDSIDASEVLRLIRAGADPNTISDRSAIDVIAAKGTPADLILLIKKGARINPKEKYAAGPMFPAIEYRNVPVIKFLLQKKVDLKRINDDGHTALDYAASKKDTLIFQLIRKNGGSYNLKNTESILFTFWTAGDSTFARYLISNGAVLYDYEAADWMERAIDPRKKYDPAFFRTALQYTKQNNWISVDGIHALHLASYFGDIDMIRFILDKGADINVVDYQKYNALSYAIANRQTQAALFLIQQKIKTDDVRMEDAISLSHLAAVTGNLEILKALVDRKADLFFKDTNGRNILTYAVFGKDAKVIKFLLDKGVDPGERDLSEYTPRHFAAFLGDLRILELMMKGYDANAASEVGLITENIYPNTFSFGPIEGMKIFTIPSTLDARTIEFLESRGVKNPARSNE